VLSLLEEQHPDLADLDVREDPANRHAGSGSTGSLQGKLGPMIETKPES
jgi:hypothetical protein